MAKSSAEPPGRSGSQFYVVTGADAGLPPEYALVGKVSEGIRRRRTDRQARHAGRKAETDGPDRRDHDRTGLSAARLRRMAKVDVGDTAPDFELPGTGGKTYRLADYRGRNVVLAFYPGDCDHRLHEAVLLLPRRGRAARRARRRGAGHLAAVGRLARALGRGAGAQRAAAGRRGSGGRQGYGVTGWLDRWPPHRAEGRARRPLRAAGDLRHRRRGDRPPPPRLAHRQRLRVRRRTSSGQSPRSR